MDSASRLHGWVSEGTVPWGCGVEVGRSQCGVECACVMDRSSGSENTLPLAGSVAFSKAPKLFPEGASVSETRDCRASQGGGRVREVLCVGTCVLSAQW